MTSRAATEPCNWLPRQRRRAATFADAAAAAGRRGQSRPALAYVPRGGQAVDFDENGFVDLVFGSRLMLNNGDGTFSGRQRSGRATFPRSRTSGLQASPIVDLDGDLDLDASRTSSVTRLYRNTRAASSTTARNIGAPLLGERSSASASRPATSMATGSRTWSIAEEFGLPSGLGARRESCINVNGQACNSRRPSSGTTPADPGEPASNSRTTTWHAETTMQRQSWPTS